MAKSLTSWKAGASGNPGGRPRGKRALTQILEEAANEVAIIGGETITGKDMIARMVIQFLTTGEVMLGGRQLQASINDWLAAVKWFYSHVDGAAPKGDEIDAPREVEVRIVRVQKPYMNPAALAYYAQDQETKDSTAHPPSAALPHPTPQPPPHSDREGEQDAYLWEDGE
jgi:hypothetical protein